MLRRSPPRISRRAALQLGCLGGLGLTLADFLAWSSCRGDDKSTGDLQSTADAVIFIHLQGGPSHLDTLDMKPAAPAEEKGEFQPIASKFAGLPVCEHLPKLAASIDRWTLVRGISHSAGAHPQANQYLFSGNAVSPAVTHPALGSVAVKERPCPPGLTVDKLARREKLLRDLDTVFRRADASSDVVDGLDRFGKQAQEMILSERTRTAFDTSREPESISRLFAADAFGQSLLLAARLVEFGVRFVTVNFESSWDTHADNFESLRTKLLPPFDAGITAVTEALTAKGLLDRTLIFAGGEFGRTPTINKGAGRDHWPRASWALFTGGGIKAGQLIGGTDAKGHGPDDSTHIKPDDLAATIYRALGIDHTQELQTRTGRPVDLVPHGSIISGIFD